MTLNELQNIIGFDFDFADDEIDATFYTELNDINPKYAKQIQVKSINTLIIVCDFTNFIKHHKTAIKKYIYDNYQLAWASLLFNGLYPLDGEIDAEAYAYFIEHDMDTFLTKGEQK